MAAFRRALPPTRTAITTEVRHPFFSQVPYQKKRIFFVPPLFPTPLRPAYTARLIFFTTLEGLSQVSRRPGGPFFLFSFFPFPRARAFPPCEDASSFPLFRKQMVVPLPSPPPCSLALAPYEPPFSRSAPLSIKIQTLCSPLLRGNTLCFPPFARCPSRRKPDRLFFFKELRAPLVLTTNTPRSVGYPSLISAVKNPPLSEKVGFP